MVTKIRVSRDGLSRCPGCLTHIRVAEDIKDTTCPFCGASIIPSRNDPAESRSAFRDLMTGRTGVVTASLFGLSTAIAGCGDDDPPPPASTAEVTESTDQTGATDSTDSTDSADTTDPSTDPIEVTESSDPGPVDVYGLPPDNGGIDPDEGNTADVTESTDTPDVDEEIETTESDDPGPVDLYGMPPIDAGSADDGAPPPEPAYGVPPPDAG